MWHACRYCELNFRDIQTKQHGLPDRDSSWDWYQLRTQVTDTLSTSTQKTIDILKRIAKHDTKRWSALNQVPHGGHELQNNAKGNCELRKWNTLQDEGYIPIRPWLLEHPHLWLQKLSAHQMQNIQKNSPPGSETSCPSEITTKTLFGKLEAVGLFTASSKGLKFPFGQTPPTWSHQILNNPKILK